MAPGCRFTNPVQTASAGWINSDKITDVVPTKIVTFVFIEKLRIGSSHYS